MINRIMTTRAAALAFAAPLLLAAPALADHNQSPTQRSGATISVQTGNGSLYFNTGNNRLSYASHNRRNGDYRGYRVNQYGQNREEVRRLKRRAIRACRRAIVDEAYAIGFRDVDFEDGRRAHQIGPHGFRVTFNEVEFESRRRDIERRVSCTVRGGNNVKHIEGLPRRGHRGYGRRDRDDHHRRNRDHRGHRGY